MRFLARWLLIAICFALAPAHGDVLLMGVGKKPTGGGGVTCSSSEGNAFLARASAVTNSTDKTNYCTLIDGLVTDSLFSRLDALYILAAPDSATALLNLVSSSCALTAISSPTFTAGQGYTGNGSSAYLDTGTGCVPSSGTLQYQRDSASFGVYTLTNPAGDNSIAMGSQDTVSIGTLSDFLTRQAGGTAIYRINTGTLNQPTNATRVGMYVVTRTSSTAAALYKNKSLLNSNSADNSTAITSLPKFFILARNDNATPTGFASEQIAAAFLGASMNATQASNLSSRINCFVAAYTTPAFSCP